MRHGETEWNAISRMQGQLDSALTARGRAQTETNARVLAAGGVQTLYCSPLGRARQSAEIINHRLRVPIHTDARIKEWDCGDWSGHLYEDVKRHWAEEWAGLEADRFNYRGPSCENYPDMIARAQPFLAELLGHPARRIAIVSHGLIGRVMIATLLGLDARATLGFHQPNEVVYCVSVAKDHTHAEHFIAGDGPFTGLVWR